MDPAVDCRLSCPCTVVVERDGRDGDGRAGRSCTVDTPDLSPPVSPLGVGVGGVTIGSPLVRGELGTVVEIESIVGALDSDATELSP